MVQKQKHRAPKLKPVQLAYHEGTSSLMPEANSLDKEDQAVEEKQSYAMVTRLLQILVYMQSPGIKKLPANFFI